jgi:Leucine-rich repeat (LRR) protein
MDIIDLLQKQDKSDDDYKQIHSLTTFDWNYNYNKQISLPTEIGLLTSLIEFNCSFNIITTLPT